jgi:hypothetical protein
MDTNILRVGLGAFWLFAGLVLLFRNAIGLNFLDERFDPTNLTLAGWMGIAFFVWNMVRWNADRLRSQRVVDDAPWRRRRYREEEEI